MSLRKQQHLDCSEKEDILNRSVRPSSFKLFEKRQLPNGSPQGSNNSRKLNHTTQPVSNHRRSRADSSIGCPTNPTDNTNCFGAVAMQTAACSSQCEQRWKSIFARLSEIESKLEMTNLKLQETTTSKELESTKQLDTFNRLINLQKKSEKVEYNLWEMREIDKNDRQEVEKMALKLATLNQQTKTDLRLLEERIEQLQSGQNPEDMRQKLESIRVDQNRKLKSMYEALEDMGNLQASMVENLNSVRSDLNRVRDYSVGDRGLSQQQNKQNMPKYNTVRMDSSEHWKAAGRKQSYY